MWIVGVAPSSCPQTFSRFHCGKFIDRVAAVVCGIDFPPVSINSLPALSRRNLQVHRVGARDLQLEQHSGEELDEGDEGEAPHFGRSNVAHCLLLCLSLEASDDRRPTILEVERSGKVLLEDK